MPSSRATHSRPAQTRYLLGWWTEYSQIHNECHSEKEAHRLEFRTDKCSDLERTWGNSIFGSGEIMAGGKPT